MSDRINCRNCIHFNDLEHRCCLNDGKVIKRECYFVLSNRKPQGKDVVIENLKTKIANLTKQLALTEKALELACDITNIGKAKTISILETVKYFKEQAKEMTKSE